MKRQVGQKHVGGRPSLCSPGVMKFRTNLKSLQVLQPSSLNPILLGFYGDFTTKA